MTPLGKAIRDETASILEKLVAGLNTENLNAEVLRNLGCIAAGSPKWAPRKFINILFLTIADIICLNCFLYHTWTKKQAFSLEYHG